MYCGEVPSIANSFISNITSFHLGGKVEYTCFDGFTPSVDEPVVCLDDATWATNSGTAFECQGASSENISLFISYYASTDTTALQ